MTTSFPYTFPFTLGGPPVPAAAAAVQTLGAAPNSVWARNLLALQIDPVIRLFSPANRLIWNLGGPTAPMAGEDEGMILSQFSGLNAPFELVDLQGARQDGITNLDKVFQPAEVDMVLELSAAPGADTRRILRWWTETWAGNRRSRLTYWTPELGDWWMWLRQFKPITNQFKLSYSQSGSLQLPWAARGDDAFWSSYDSVDRFDGATAGSGNGAGYISLVQRGTEVGWPRYLVGGPGTFTIGDGTSGNSVTFGPTVAGQQFLITTLPRLRSVIDLTPNIPIPVPPTQQPLFQELFGYMIDLVSLGNTIPLLSEIESIFGTVPPQGNAYSLLTNRFNTPIVGLEESEGPYTTQIPVAISGGTAGQSAIVGALTPLRTWPE